ncbi:MAG: DinB family protein [Gemmatimonadota bacterium]|nr:DinB family protein [Gemmatimonadota bacterium]
MIRSVADFEHEWKEVSSASRRIFGALTDESLAQAVSKQDRTLGRIAWHVVGTIPEMMAKLGLTIDGPQEHAPVPRTAVEIRDSYGRAADSVLHEVSSRWKDSDLLREQEMYGEQWTLGFALRVLINHEIHHRGQMTVLMRQAGLSVPGILGPAREEWAQWGMQPPTV